MAIKYEVKKVVFGFDKTNTEKFVAQTKVLGLVKFDKLCEEVQKVSMAPRGVVKMVIDGGYILHMRLSVIQKDYYH